MFPRLRARLLPALAHDHPGYFLVVVGILLTHIVGALDELLPGAPERYGAPAWSVAQQIMPIGFAGLGHLVLGILIIWGLYRPKNDMQLARVAFVLSVGMFTVLAGSFLYAAAINGHSTYISASWAFLSLLCSVAAAREPSRQVIKA